MYVACFILKLRAMNDVNATINLIAHSSYNDNSLAELIINSKNLYLEW